MPNPWDAPPGDYGCGDYTKGFQSHYIEFVPELLFLTYYPEKEVDYPQH